MLVIKSSDWKATEEEALAAFRWEIGQVDDIGEIMSGDKLLKNDDGEFMVVGKNIPACHIDDYDVIKVY